MSPGSYRGRPVQAMRLSARNAAEVADWVSDHAGQADLWPDRLDIRTAHGVTYVPTGNWVIRLAGGKFDTCGHEVFMREYEAAADGPG